MNEFKCPICGCTKHYEIKVVSNETPKLVTENGKNVERRPGNNAVISYEASITGDAMGNVRISLSDHAKAYLCEECGHIDFFSENLLSSIVSSYEKYNREIRLLNDQIEQLQKNKAYVKDKIDSTNKRLKELDELLKDENITVKQLKSYEDEQEKLDFELTKLVNELFDIEKRLSDANGSF